MNPGISISILIAAFLVTPAVGIISLMGTRPPSETQWKDMPKHTEISNVLMAIRLTEGASKAYGIQQDFLLRQLHAESNYNPNAVSKAGAVGIAQFMPEAWQEAIDAGAIPTGADRRNPAHSVAAQAWNMSRLLDKFDGDLVKAAAAYHTGEGAVGKLIRKHGDDHYKDHLGREGRRYLNVIFGKEPGWRKLKED